MAEFLNGQLRVNAVVESLAALQATAKARVSSIPVPRGFTTAPDGRVLDPFGKVIYTPTKLSTETNK